MVLSAGLAIVLLTTFLSTVTGSETTEFNLDPDGKALEINWGMGNELWVTDFGNAGDTETFSPGVLWQIATDSSVYTRYEVFVGAADARVDSSGVVWWANTNLNTLNSVIPGESLGQSWPLTGTVGTPTGLDIDSSNNIWITDPEQTLVARFDPSKSELCAYGLPDGGKSLYVLAYDGYIWLGDWINHRILRIDPQNDQIREWQLDSVASPTGLAIDEMGNFWWADDKGPGSDGVLARLRPSLNIVTTYVSSYTPFTPAMITYNAGKVWFTDVSEPFDFGWLDPNEDNGTTTLAASATHSISPNCSNSVTGYSIPVTTTMGISDWQPTIHLENRQIDWSSYSLEKGSVGWGIAAKNNNAWVVDSGLQRVVHLVFEECQQLVVSKYGLGQIPKATPRWSVGCHQGYYLSGEVIQLEAQPAEGLRVGGWFGTDNNRSTELINQVTMPDRNHEAGAIYLEGYPVFLPVTNKS